ncbi:MAG: aldo/keto reductase [Candidatus Hodarchaeales archaeon]|jgi:aryl-alcohol dehydrogenase-like predicted oxidoreductase
MNKISARKLGRSNIEVSAMGLGCWAIGGPFWEGNKPHGWGTVDDTESIRAIQRAIDLGVNFFDTADVYGAGHSEKILGKAIQDYREDVVIATKFGNLFDEKTKQITGTNSSPKYIRKACQASLQRLNTDYIDLYQLHIWTLPAGTTKAILEVLDDLKDEGLIRTYGWSTDVTSNAHLFAERQNCSAIQQELNVFVDGREIIELCEKYNLASINRTVLAMGLLTGKYRSDSQLSKDDIRGDEPEWMKYFKDGKPVEEWLKKLDLVRDILASEGRTVVQGALAWVWARSEKTIPIPGFKSVEQVEENITAMEFGPLNPNQMQEIDKILGERSYRY